MRCCYGCVMQRTAIINDTLPEAVTAITAEEGCHSASCDCYSTLVTAEALPLAFTVFELHRTAYTLKTIYKHVGTKYRHYTANIVIVQGISIHESQPYGLLQDILGVALDASEFHSVAWLSICTPEPPHISRGSKSREAGGFSLGCNVAGRLIVHCFTTCKQRV